MSFQKILPGMLLVLFIISCTADSVTGEEEKQGEEPPVEEPNTWEEEGLQDLEVFSITRAGDYLYAGTSGGFYRAYLADPPAWQNMGFGTDSTRVRDIIAFSEQELLITSSLNGNVLFKSEDRGESWEGWPLEISDEEDYKNRISHLEANPKNPDTLFGFSGVVLRSEDGGKTWKRTEGSGSYFLYVSKEYPNQVWAGGSWPIFAPKLFKSNDSGDKWVNLSNNIYNNSDGSIYDVVISPQDEQMILISTGQKSTDGGETWENSAENFKGASIFEISNINPNKVFASRINYTDLYLSFSEDFGDSWKTNIFEEEVSLGMKINDMVPIVRESQEILYIATTQGVYSYAFEEE